MTKEDQFRYVSVVCWMGMLHFKCTHTYLFIWVSNIISSIKQSKKNRPFVLKWKAKSSSWKTSKGKEHMLMFKNSLIQNIKTLKKNPQTNNLPACFMLFSLEVNLAYCWPGISCHCQVKALVVLSTTEYSDKNLYTQISHCQRLWQVEVLWVEILPFISIRPRGKGEAYVPKN